LDPVGATVGQRGARVQAVVAELGGEKIDVIDWSDDPSTFVAKALSPAQVLGVDIDEENRIANVTVPERMLSLAIGREGQNARLAAKLTGWRIDIRSDVAQAAREATEAESEAALPTDSEAARTADEDVTPDVELAVPVVAAEGSPAPAVADPPPAVADEGTSAPRRRSRKTAPVAPETAADVTEPTPKRRSRKAVEEVSS
jgi:N utilization substance protein A